MHNIEANLMFKYPQEPLEFATLSHGFKFFCSKGLLFENDSDDLGEYKASHIELESGRHLAIFARPDHPNYRNQVSLIAPGSNPNPIESMDELLSEIGEGRMILQWLTPLLTEGKRWLLASRDPAGNHYVVGHFQEKTSAKSALEIYGKNYRDQYFWLEPAEPLEDHLRDG